MHPDLLLVAAARYELGWVGAQEVIDAAANLVDDDSGPALVALASAGKDLDRAELTPLITDALDELAHGVVIDAPRIVALAIAEDILSERVAPMSGARAMWRLARERPMIEEPLSPFIHLASEDDPDDELDSEIRHAASVLLGDQR